MPFAEQGASPASGILASLPWAWRRFWPGVRHEACSGRQRDDSGLKGVRVSGDSALCVVHLAQYSTVGLCGKVLTGRPVRLSAFHHLPSSCLVLFTPTARTHKRGCDSTSTSTAPPSNERTRRRSDGPHKRLEQRPIHPRLLLLRPGRIQEATREAEEEAQ